MAAGGEGSDARACAFIEIAQEAAGGPVELYGVGLDTNIVTASIKAIISAANRAAAVVAGRETKQVA